MRLWCNTALLSVAASNTLHSGAFCRNNDTTIDSMSNIDVDATHNF